MYSLAGWLRERWLADVLIVKPALREAPDVGAGLRIQPGPAQLLLPSPPPPPRLQTNHTTDCGHKTLLFSRLLTVQHCAHPQTVRSTLSMQTARLFPWSRVRCMSKGGRNIPPPKASGTGNGLFRITSWVGWERRAEGLIHRKPFEKSRAVFWSLWDRMPGKGLFA